MRTKATWCPGLDTGKEKLIKWKSGGTRQSGVLFTVWQSPGWVKVPWLSM